MKIVAFFDTLPGNLSEAALQPAATVTVRTPGASMKAIMRPRVDRMAE